MRFLGTLPSKEFHRHDFPAWKNVKAGAVYRCDCGKAFVRTLSILDASGVQYWRPLKRRERKHIAGGASTREGEGLETWNGEEGKSAADNSSASAVVEPSPDENSQSANTSRSRAMSMDASCERGIHDKRGTQ